MNGSELYLNFPYFIVRHHSNSFQIELKSTYANLHFFIYTCSMFFLIKTQKMTDKNETRNETLKNSTICRNSNKPVKFKFFIPIDKYLVGYTCEQCVNIHIKYRKLAIYKGYIINCDYLPKEFDACLYNINILLNNTNILLNCTVL